MGKLTTHILDTSAGIPGAGITIRLFRVHNGQDPAPTKTSNSHERSASATGVERELLHATCSNDDGRCDGPLLAGDGFAKGTYELEFDVAPYFAKTGAVVAEPPFLDVVTLRFTIAEDSHYHVPLLVSPWSYSTYRGS